MASDNIHLFSIVYALDDLRILGKWTPLGKFFADPLGKLRSETLTVASATVPSVFRSRAITRSPDHGDLSSSSISAKMPVLVLDIAVGHAGEIIADDPVQRFMPRFFLITFWKAAGRVHEVFE